MRGDAAGYERVHRRRRSISPLREYQMKKRIGVVLATLTVLGVLAPAAMAEPSSGPGSDAGDPNDANAKCHPPGQTTETPAASGR